MKHEHRTDCARAAEALRRLVGGEAERFFATGIPASLFVPKAHVIVAAGDSDRPLDPFELKTLAIRENRDVLAIWVDRILAGHAFLIDAVLTRDDRTEQFCAYRLWMKPGRRRTLIPQKDYGPSIAIDETGLRLVPTPPWRNQVERLTGIAQGQAWLHPNIWGGTPYATALDRNLDR